MNNRFLEIYNEKVFDLLNIGNERLSIVDSGSDVLVRGLSERRVYNNRICIRFCMKGVNRGVSERRR